MLTTNVTKPIQVPHEPGESMVIRMLNHLELHVARTTRLGELAAQMKVLSGVTFPQNGSGPKEEPDPIAGYDQRTLLNAGIVSWSYGPEVKPDALDGVTAEWAAREILRYSRPGEAEVKPLSSLSTGA